MQRWAVTIVLLLAISAARPAYAAERGPVCREPSVVDEIDREIRAKNYYGTVRTSLITEQPTADPGLVRCQVCVLSAPYETMRFGDQPIQQCVAHDFEVRVLSAGFVVRDLR